MTISWKRFQQFGFWLVFLAAPHARSQSQLEITIQQFTPEEVRGYVHPLGDMFGANMNAGLYHSAAIPDDGFHVRVDLVAMASVVREEHRTYEAKLPAGFVPQGGSYRTATIFGGKGTTFIDAQSGMQYKVSDGMLNTNYFPLFTPQITIGTVLGTQAFLRYISTPSLSSNKLPPSRLFGAGIRHSISQYIPQCPLDISLGGFYSNFSVGNILELEGTAINLQFSKSVLLFTLYGGAGWETSTMRLHYTYSANGIVTPMLVNATIDGGNTFRATTGLMIDLQAIKVYADANFGTIQHFSGGIGFGF